MDYAYQEQFHGDNMDQASSGSSSLESARAAKRHLENRFHRHHQQQHQQQYEQVQQHEQHEQIATIGQDRWNHYARNENDKHFSNAVSNEEDEDDFNNEDDFGDDFGKPASPKQRHLKSNFAMTENRSTDGHSEEDEEYENDDYEEEISVDDRRGRSKRSKKSKKKKLPFKRKFARKSSTTTTSSNNGKAQYVSGAPPAKTAGAVAVRGGQATAPTPTPPQTAAGAVAVRGGNQNGKNSGRSTPLGAVAVRGGQQSGKASGSVTPTPTAGAVPVRGGTQNGKNSSTTNSNTTSTTLARAVAVRGHKPISIFDLEESKGRKGAVNTGATTAGAVAVQGPVRTKSIDSISDESCQGAVHVRGAAPTKETDSDDDFPGRTRRRRLVTQTNAANDNGNTIRYSPNQHQPSNVTIGLEDSFSIQTGHSGDTVPARNRATETQETANVVTATVTPVSPTVPSDRRRSFNARPSRIMSVASSNSGEPARDLPLNQRRSSLKNPMVMVMDDQGHAMSVEEMRTMWLSAGKCGDCGTVRTHRKVKVGPFGVFRRMEPQTVEGLAYKGVCLCCHDVFAVRAILRDDSVPLDLPRHNPRAANSMSASMRSIHSNPDGVYGKKQTPMQVLCASWKFQVCLGVFCVIALGGIIAVAVTLSGDPSPFISQPPTNSPTTSPTTTTPTMAPTSFEWIPTSVIIPREPIKGFAYNIVFSADGLRIAIASPFASDSRGRVDVYESREGTDGEEEWVPLGNILRGGRTGDLLGRGMSLSADGTTLAIGSPGHQNGFVQVYRLVDDKWTQIGQTLSGPSVGSQFGQSVAASMDGTRIVVGAPYHSLSQDSYEGIALIYLLTAQREWVVEGEVLGPNAGDELGYSVSMSRSGGLTILGAPGDDTRWQNGGQVHWFARTNSDEWVDFLDDEALGHEREYRMGEKVSLSGEGTMGVTGSHELRANGFQQAGHIDAWTFGRDTLTHLGVPIEGLKPLEGLAYDFSAGFTGKELAATTVNANGYTGAARVYKLSTGQWVQRGSDVPGLPIGNVSWVGGGPSIAYESEKDTRLAVGYESVVAPDGTETPMIQIFEFFGVVAEENPSTNFTRLGQPDEQMLRGGNP